MRIISDAREWKARFCLAIMPATVGHITVYPPSCVLTVTEAKTHMVSGLGSDSLTVKWNASGISFNGLLLNQIAKTTS